MAATLFKLNLKGEAPALGESATDLCNSAVKVPPLPRRAHAVTLRALAVALIRSLSFIFAAALRGA